MLETFSWTAVRVVKRKIFSKSTFCLPYIPVHPGGWRVWSRSHVEWPWEFKVTHEPWSWGGHGSVMSPAVFLWQVQQQDQTVPAELTQLSDSVLPGWSGGHRCVIIISMWLYLYPTEWRCSPAMTREQQVRNKSVQVVLFTPNSVTVFIRDHEGVQSQKMNGLREQFSFVQSGLQTSKC